MPIYEYQCPECATEFEELVFGDGPPACPLCGGVRGERLMSRPCLYRPAGADNGCDAPPPTSGGGCGGCTASSCAGCR
ncbi:MAG: zinc ribbon domain-containing protein [Desulfovibrio sp.]|jgi:putative FmdB family regulatory protein|nr:zinc ribbon domain-containing protein [Desulfovibrio sp.]